MCDGQSMRIVFLKFLIITAAILFSVSHADVCPEELLNNPYVHGVDKCVFSLLRSQPEQQKFSENLIHQAVYGISSGNKAPDMPLNYRQLVELAALVGTPRAIDAILDLVPADDETRSFAVARLYELQAPRVLERLVRKDEAIRKSIINSIAWGVVNNHYLFINTQNYDRLAVGQHWELTDPDHPNHNIVRQISEEIFTILNTWPE